MRQRSRTARHSPKPADFASHSSLSESFFQCVQPSQRMIIFRPGSRFYLRRRRLPSSVSRIPVDRGAVLVLTDRAARSAVFALYPERRTPGGGLLAFAEDYVHRATEDTILKSHFRSSLRN